MRSSFLFSVALAVLCRCGSITLEPCLTVTTQHGPVHGTTRKSLGTDRPVYSFFGIPYARSPDYSFRFHNPVDPWRWSDVRDVTNDRVPFCRQDPQTLNRMRENALFEAFIDSDYPMKEDCLNVNVFTPILPSEKSKTHGLPVIVWFHGGSYQTTATTHKMWMLSAYEDVVLVTVQYRLGVFGFLSFEDEQWSTSNTGLLDQLKALEWVRDNVRAFGGDPNLVTIFGLSAGGYSASAHSVSSMSRGLFHRVVAGSGVVTLPPMWDKNQRTKALKISDAVNCNFSGIPPTATCLRNHVTSTELIDAARSNNIVFKAIVDGKFFHSNANELIEKRSFDPSIPLLVGGVAGEYDFILSRKAIAHQYLGPGMNRAIAEKLIRKHFHESYPELSSDEKNIEEIFKEYLSDRSSWIQLLRGVLDFMADATFNFNFVKVASGYSDAGTDVYFYNFVPKPSFYYNNSVLNLKRSYDFDRADHSDDLPFFFGFPFLPGLEGKGLTFTEQEKSISRRMMKMLATFAKTGVPSLVESIVWPRYPAYTVINETITVEQDFRKRQMSIWNRLFERTARKPSYSDACALLDGDGACIDSDL